MNSSTQHIIYTIGHSTHTMNNFIVTLQSFDIKNLVDVRSMPGSRKFSQFNKENLETVLPENGIHYIYMKDLGGRRKVRKDSKNNRWENASFRAYADYMETDNFKNAVTELEKIALQTPTAYMCAETISYKSYLFLFNNFIVFKNFIMFNSTAFVIMIPSSRFSYCL